MRTGWTLNLVTCILLAYCLLAVLPNALPAFLYVHNEERTYRLHWLIDCCYGAAAAAESCAINFNDRLPEIIIFNESDEMDPSIRNDASTWWCVRALQ